MDIKEARKLAAKCLRLSVNYVELSPSAQKIFSAMSGINSSSSNSWLKRWGKALLKKIICWRLDQLILVDDSSVRVMVIRAMEHIKYRSRHIGLIATLCALKDTGDVLDLAGEKINTYNVNFVVRSYLSNLLEVPDYDKQLAQCKRHWEGVLSIDYTKEFSVERCLDFSDKVPAYVTRELPPEEVAVKIADNKAEVKALYQYDLDKLQQKKISGFYEQRKRQVYQSLDDIMTYYFQTPTNSDIVDEVIDLLLRMAKSGNFPEEWLLQLAKKDRA